MTTPFSARDAKLSGAVDRGFGEPFVIEAMISQNDVDRRKIPDPSRATFTATGIWEGLAKSQLPNAAGASSDDRAHGWNASFPSASFDAANLLWTPQPGDKITRSFNGAIYTIAQPFPDQMGRVLLQLTARKR